MAISRTVIAGMHRSGTSLLASLLEAWGVRAGDRLLPADRGNPAGYFEDVDFLSLNRRMLVACTPAEAGHRDWGWTESEAFDTAPLAAFRAEAAALVAARDREEQSWGWKDPRTSVLLDFWDDVLGHEARFLLVYRYPWDVADSMLRSGAGVWLDHPDYPARIWTYYNRRILDFHRRHRERTLLVSTNRLLRDPEEFAALVAERFGIEADGAALARLRDEKSFVWRDADDPLARLWSYTNTEAMDVLTALDASADLGNDRSWPARAPIRKRGAERPRLSVVIPCHDDGDYVIDAIASVERNAPPDTELIVVDDGSTQPRTRDVLAALREAGVQVIEQPQSGLSAARNRGIAASSGEFILPLDADNRLLPDFAAAAIAALDGDPAIGVVYGDRREFGLRNADVAVPELDIPRLLWSNYIDACAVMRRAVWSDCGGFDVTFSDWEDWDLWLSAVERGWRFLHLGRTTFEYRLRPNSLHQRFLRRADYPAALQHIYEKHRALFAAHASEILLAGHIERRQLFADSDALRSARDSLQVEIDRLAAARSESPAPAASEPPAPASLTSATRVFTIIARNYIAFARVLAASLARHNPGTRLQVVVLDDPDRTISGESSFDVVHADELPFEPPSDFYTMAAIYDVTELATAVKPWAFEHFFNHDASVVIYLDPDIEVFDSLGPLEPLTMQHGIVLTPHITEPLPRDDRRPNDRDLLLAGIYNLGFLALSADGSRTLLPWWRERLRRDCLNDPSQGLFVDQRWIDFSPALFAPAILKDAGYNVAYWNLPHRLLERDGERIVVNGQPLRFFHFSGFSPNTPHLLSKHQHDDARIRLNDHPLLAGLCARYAQALHDAGFSESSAAPYGFAATSGGLQLDSRMRRLLRRSYLDDETSGESPAFPSVFTEAGAQDAIDRLTRPSPHSPEIPAYLGEIWSERADLRIAFPRIDSTDADRFLDWVRRQGRDIPPELIPPAAPRAIEPAQTLTPGVNVYGYTFAESGTGQIVRSVVAALAAEEIPYAVVPFTRTISRQQRQFEDRGAAVPSFDTNLICVNADQVPLFFDTMQRQRPPHAYNIGLWAWEVEDLPPAMARSEQHLDEVWGISRFTAASLSRSLAKPVRAFPLPVVIPDVRRRSRAELGMPEGFLFLFCFDYDSVFERKNPLAVVAAFKQTFGDRDGVALFIKTTNAGRHAAHDARLRAAAAGQSNIVIVDAYVTNDDYFSMIDACDCYVSLHRSEGFGLTVAEAMALGKPVISTAYSSTMEFANESNSFPVPAKLVEVGPRAAPYHHRSKWADPDVTIAAQQMKRVYDDGDAANAIGARARHDIETLHSPAARGPLLRQLLDESRRTRIVAPMREEVTRHAAGRTFEDEAAVAESLLGSPRADLPSPMQRLMNPVRRLVLRAIRVYWVQQLAVNRALLAAIRALRHESGDELSALRQKIAKLEDDLQALREHREP